MSNRSTNAHRADGYCRTRMKKSIFRSSYCNGQQSTKLDPELYHALFMGIRRLAPNGDAEFMQPDSHVVGF